MTERFRRHSPRLSQYVECGFDDDASESLPVPLGIGEPGAALARRTSYRNEWVSCMRRTNESRVNSWTRLRRAIARALSARTASPPAPAAMGAGTVSVIRRSGVLEIVSGASITQPGSVAVGGSDARRVSAPCSIAAAVRGERRRAKSAPSSRQSLPSEEMQGPNISHRYSRSSVPQIQPRPPMPGGESSSGLDGAGAAWWLFRRIGRSRMPLGGSCTGNARTTAPGGDEGAGGWMGRTRNVTYATLMIRSVVSSGVSLSGLHRIESHTSSKGDLVPRIGQLDNTSHERAEKDSILSTFSRERDAKGSKRDHMRQQCYAGREGVRSDVGGHARRARSRQ